MHHIKLLLIIGLLATGLVAGCKPALDSKAPSKVTKASEDSEANVVAICSKCGQIEGSDLCCKPGQELCPMCGLVKDSPGCCLLPKGADPDVKLCTKCGFIKGSTDCCKTTGKQKCPSCGLVKGSPGCCKIK